MIKPQDKKLITEKKLKEYHMNIFKHAKNIL